MVHVPDVESQLLLPADVVSAPTLCETGNSRAHMVTTSLFLSVLTEILREQRARTDKTHVAFEDIPKFRHLIEAGGTKHDAEFGQTILIRTVAIKHRTKFVQIKRRGSKTRPLLSKQSGTTHLTANRCGNDQHQRPA